MRYWATIIFLTLSLSGFAQKKKANVKSQSVGTVRKGELKNGVRLPYKSGNFSYFSPFSYGVLRRAYVNSKVYRTVIEAYQICEKTCPNQKFRVMECSRKHGGKMKPHRTHQNGTSVDFMTPLKKKDKQFRFYDHLGIWHYLMAFDKSGRMKGTRKVKIDYETMAKHIIALDDASKKEGLRIKKVIFKIELQAGLFKTKYGKELKRRGIYFVRALPKIIDNLHDEHYHVDFEEVGKVVANH